MNSDVIQGFAQAVMPTSLLATAVGSLLGIVVGMIPGMTISTGIIILLPLTFVMDPASSIALLLGLYVGGMMGGSFAAILLNIPGTPSASATGLDGYPMAARGEAGRALGIAIRQWDEPSCVFAAFAGVGLAAKSVHGDRQGFVSLGADRAEAHGACGEPFDQVGLCFDLIYGDGFAGLFERQQPT